MTETENKEKSLMRVIVHRDVELALLKAQGEAGERHTHAFVNDLLRQALGIQEEKTA